MATAVSVDTYIRAETDVTFKRYAGLGGFGKLGHVRQPVPIDQQGVIRMNRDTLYSYGIFDLSSPVTIVKPEAAGRFQSLLVVNQDHSALAVEHGAGRFTYTRDSVGTRYAAFIFRTFVDASDPADIAKANQMQDALVAEQASPGAIEFPDWDEASLTMVRQAVNVLASTRASSKGYFGDARKLDPISHLLGTAYGWGGNPEEAAVYVNFVPERNDGKVAHVLRVSDVPVDGFWSVTVYNADGFMQKNDAGLYAYNNVTARKDPDGAVTIHFGGDPSARNYLPIAPGWNYMVRLYQPRSDVIEGRYTFPDPVAVG
jgi:hypothetical protein